MRFINILTFLVVLVFTACNSNDDDVQNNTDIQDLEKGFANDYNASYNEYYRNNNIKTVTATFKNTSGRKNVYHYNKSGYLHQLDIESINLDGGTLVNSTTWSIDPDNDQVVYEGDLLVKQYYTNSLLTASTYTYENDLLIKKSDFRNEELFYVTDYNYNENRFIESSTYFCYSSAGLGFGVTCTERTDFEYTYKNGNLVSIKNLNKNENILELIYNNDSNMPTTAIDNNIELELSYTYFN